jgi:hypothetical protein
MTLKVAAQHLPTELLLRVLEEWVGQQRVIIDCCGHSNYTLSYTKPENPDPFSLISKTSDTPSSIFKEYFHVRIHSWLTDTKDFSDPSTLYLSHLLMSLKMSDRLGAYILPTGQPWDTMLRDLHLTLRANFPILKDHNMQYALFPHLAPLHGFEKIKLDFTSEQYFAVFDVSVPPFHYADTTRTNDNLYPDPYCHSAGAFLAHTRELELHFGTAYKSTNPWYNVQEPAWCETNTTWNYGEARLRPRVCESGRVIDWILEYAWYAGFLQHIRKIRLTGDIQEWVKRKWEDILRRHGEYVDECPGEQEVGIFAVYRPDVIEIETIGMVGDNSHDDDDDDEAWMPWNHYPPRCTCEVGCWRLKGGVVEEELQDKTWDDFEQYEVEVVGDWMDGVEVGDVVYDGVNL